MRFTLRVFLPLFMLTYMVLMPFQASAAPVSSVTVVSSWERFGSMINVFAPLGHGNIGGVYYYSSDLVPDLDEVTANRLMRLRSSFEHARNRYGDHIGLPVPAYPHILEGRQNGAIVRETIGTRETEGFAEFDAVFFDPRSNDFAVRMQSVYCVNGHSGSLGCTMYIEYTWEQLEKAVSRAGEYVSAGYHAYYPDPKNKNQFIGAVNAEENSRAGLTGRISFGKLLELDNAGQYVYWSAWENGRAVDRLASGICAFTSVMGNAVGRGLMAHGIQAQRESTPHSEDFLLYYANGSDPLIKAKYDNYNGLRGIQDTTVYYPSIDAVYTLPEGVTIRVEPQVLYYNPNDSLFVYVVGVQVW